MEINNEEVKNYMSMSFEYPGVRAHDDFLMPVVWNLSIDLVAVEIKGIDTAVAGGLAYHKLQYWVEHCLSHAIVANVHDELMFNISNITENTMLYCPGEPTDDLLVLLLLHKITAIVSPNLIIDKVVLSGNDTSASYTAGKSSPDLPEKVTDYMTLEAKHEIPWWERADGYTFELVRYESDVEFDELYKDMTDPIERFLESYESPSDAPSAPAEILHVDKWKPKKV